MNKKIIIFLIVILLLITIFLIVYFKKKIPLLMTPKINTWDKKTDEEIKKLHPVFQPIVLAFVNELYDKYGITYRIYEGLRTFEEQQYEYDKGRTTSGSIVTNAKPGESFHQYGLGFDGVEIKNGEALWNSPNIGTIVAVGKKYGMIWGGDFKGLKDTPHWEYQKYGGWRDLLALYNSGKVTNGYVNLA